MSNSKKFSSFKSLLKAEKDPRAALIDRIDKKLKDLEAMVVEYRERHHKEENIQGLGYAQGYQDCIEAVRKSIVDIVKE